MYTPVPAGAGGDRGGREVRPRAGPAAPGAGGPQAMESYEARSAASILASVREQETRFLQLSRALEEERHRAAPPPTAWQQLVLQEQSPSSQTSMATMQEPQETVEETVTVEEDPGTPTSHVSIVTSEDGTTRRTETKVTKMVKTVTTRTVRQVPVGPDGLALLDGCPSLGGCADSTDRRFPKTGERYLPAAAAASSSSSSSTLGRAFRPGYGDAGYGEPPGEPPDAYGSLSRGLRFRPRYAAYGAGPRAEDGGFPPPGRREPGGPQPQAPDPAGPSRSQPERFQPEPYGLEDDNRSLAGAEDEAYDLDADYSTVGRGPPADRARAHRARADPSEGQPAAPLAQPERGSLASVDRLGERSPSLDSARKDARWRDPELPEVIAMLRHPLDPVKANAAAYLQHLCYESEPTKRDVRRLQGVPALVGLLGHPRAEVHRRACGALRNLSFGRDGGNKAAIRACRGVPALVHLLRRTADLEVRELVTGTLWNLSSYEPLKMEIITHGLQTLTDEVIVPDSGWESEPNEDSKPREARWTTLFKNTSGCLRNVSSDGAEARRKLRECTGLVDALLHALLSAVGKKDTDNKSVENSVCIMRNLSYHVHKEVPGAERYREPEARRAAAAQRKKKEDVSCFGGKKAKGKKLAGLDRTFDTLDSPKRTEAAKGFELLYQPEVVRLYLAILTGSRNLNTLEAAAGALQNLSAGNWTWSTQIRAAVRKERGLPVLVELLQSDSDKVVRAVAIALRNLSLDQSNKDLIGVYAMRELVRNLSAREQRPAKALEEDTVVAVLNAIHEAVTDSAENARTLVHTQGVQNLVAISKTSPSLRETKAAAHVLQVVWSYKELRGALLKDGWNKSHFQLAPSTAPRGSRGSGQAGYDDSTLPLVDKNHDERTVGRDGIPMDELGPDGYSTIDQRDRGHRARAGGDAIAAPADGKGPLKSEPPGKAPAVSLLDPRDPRPQPVDSWV
ncbi:armadillo repeat protein deleted in velo-cardio-facial syndrome isoform X2 [Tachyglossus aculeatus]|uniref:armadillo repeat protein deleted in velo-cardio-facial syndrome isoform X2 n=1 Tax=Tachyglossus aculeatus TaxID=9261 RepID=UPI0018F7585C|nr:armadillo repeat protein deleted in velo-cardio-facial syndrome isoform X2 [Tachyglossus aculeatus]